MIIEQKISGQNNTYKHCMKIASNEFDFKNCIIRNNINRKIQNNNILNETIIYNIIAIKVPHHRKYRKVK